MNESEPVLPAEFSPELELSLIGGDALSLRNLKAATKNINLRMSGRTSD